MIRFYKTTPLTTDAIIERLNANGFQSKKALLGTILASKHLRIKHYNDVVEIHYRQPLILVAIIALVIAFLIVVIGAVIFSTFNVDTTMGIISFLPLLVTYMSWAFVSGFFKARIADQEKQNIYAIISLLNLSTNE